MKNIKRMIIIALFTIAWFFLISGRVEASNMTLEVTNSHTSDTRVITVKNTPYLFLKTEWTVTGPATITNRFSQEQIKIKLTGGGTVKIKAKVNSALSYNIFTGEYSKYEIAETRFTVGGGGSSGGGGASGGFDDDSGNNTQNGTTGGSGNNTQNGITGGSGNGTGEGRPEGGTGNLNDISGNNTQNETNVPTPTPDPDSTSTTIAWRTRTSNRVADVSDPINDVDAYEPNEGASADEIKNLGKTIVGTLQTVGVVISVVTCAVLGLRYMIGSVEEKAEYKATMVPYLIGAALVFCSTTLVNVIYQLAQTMK